MNINSGLSDGAKVRLLANAPNVQQPTTILKGSHYIAAQHGFLTVPNLGVIRFHGKPFGPGNTDTIYRRLEDVNLSTGFNSPETIPIELTRLSVQSILPVNIGGTLYDMWIQLTPGERSLGEMTFVWEFPEDGTTLPKGIFHKNINIHFTAEFSLAGTNTIVPELTFVHSIYIATVRPGTWCFTPWYNSVQVNDPIDPMNNTTNLFITDQMYMLSNDLAAGGSKSGSIVPI
jgi:hypothetical protein